MPNVMRKMRCVVGLLVVLGVPAGARGQQRDTVVVRDSIARADSIRADSVRRAELARIRGEPRAMGEVRGGDLPGKTTSEDGMVAPVRPQPRVAVTAASLAGDMVADLSPKAAARPAGSRIRTRDIEGALEASYGSRLTGLLTVTLTDDGSTQRVVATDAAVTAKLPAGLAEVIVGRTAFPFGHSARLHRHAQPFPDQPLPVRVLLGETGLRGTGLQLRAGRPLGNGALTLDVAAVDRFGARIDSLHPGEPPDQSVAGIAAGGRVGLWFGMAGMRLDLGVSSISGKREQPIGCVYEGTVGPVPCPEAVNAANTRLTVLGGDARLASGDGNGRFAVTAEWLRMVVGATDLPVFSNDRFAPFYRGVHGTYDGGYVDGTVRVLGAVVVGARGDWLQNPEVGGLNDGWVGGFAGLMPFDGTRVTVSYQRRVPSSTTLATLTTAQQDARDRIVLRGTVVIGRHPGAGRD